MRLNCDVLLNCKTQQNLNAALEWIGQKGYPLGGILNKFGYVHIGPVTWVEANKICDMFPEYKPFIEVSPT